MAELIEAVTGFKAAADQVVTSADAAARLLRDTRPPTFVLGGNGITDALLRNDIPVVTSSNEARAVVVGLATALTYDWLRDAANAVRAGARLVATNHDATYPAEHDLWPGAGAILAAVEVASGVKAEIAGKPFAPMRNLLKELLGPGQVWVIGDRPDTDLGLAAAEPGWRSALVLTGVVTPENGVEPIPDMIAADLASVVEVLLQK